MIQIDEQRALIQTLDFFTPVVDEPFLFGQIAAANALSDVYAMGGTPFTAMNIGGFPRCLDKQVISQILLGGMDKLAEADVLLVGGHSVVDDELKYGMSVTGWVDPKRVMSNAGARTNDVLVLTKPLGTGIAINALKGGLITTDQCTAFTWMSQLNAHASIAMQKVRTHACTDVTGFGLVGHGYEMAKASHVQLHFTMSKIPCLDNVLEWAAMGLVPAGTYMNQRYYQDYVIKTGDIRDADLDLIYDPQTSGGLLIAVHPDDALELVNSINDHTHRATIVGCVQAGEPSIVVGK